jgi:hypothetical protein
MITCHWKNALDRAEKNLIYHVENKPENIGYTKIEHQTRIAEIYAQINDLETKISKA